MLKEAWGKGIRAWVKSPFPKPGAHGSSLTQALGDINTLTTEPDEKGTERMKFFVWLKGKKRAGRKVSM